jgi:hypothetical protein
MKNKITTLIVLVIIYFLLKYFIPFGNYIVYPINLLVTFMHEFGHSFFAIITWGDVISIQINSNWSWFAKTSWWIRDIVVSWGYLGSAIFWNLLLYIWFKKEKLSQNILYFISALIIFVAIFWFNSIFSSIILFILAWGLFALAKYTKYDSLALQFLWVSSILFIIEDFNVWPSSDLSKFSGILPSSVWMIIWLILVIAMTLWNLKIIFKKK